MIEIPELHVEDIEYGFGREVRRVAQDEAYRVAREKMLEAMKVSNEPGISQFGRVADLLAEAAVAARAVAALAACWYAEDDQPS